MRPVGVVVLLLCGLVAGCAADYMSLAQEAKQEKQYDLALSHLETASSLEPGWWEPYNRRGVILFEMGRLFEAFTWYSRAAALAPHIDTPSYNKGWCAFALGQYEEAVFAFEAAMSASEKQLSPEHLARLRAWHEKAKRNAALVKEMNRSQTDRAAAAVAGQPQIYLVRLPASQDDRAWHIGQVVFLPNISPRAKMARDAAWQPKAPLAEGAEYRRLPDGYEYAWTGKEANIEAKMKQRVTVDLKAMTKTIEWSRTYANGSIARWRDEYTYEARSGGTISRGVRAWSQIDDLADFAASLSNSLKDYAGEEVSAVIQTAMAQSPLPSLAASSRPADRCLAVVVGTDQYQDQRVPPLRFAEQDARKIAESLVHRCGFRQEDICVLLGAEATQRNIRSALGTFLARNAGKDDLVIIFFSGHGAPEPDLTGKAPDGYLKYLVPYDANKDDLFATGIPMSEIATYFERIEARRILFFADTCYSGATGGRTFALPGRRGVTRSGNFLEEIVQGEGRVILTASNVNEVAAEDEKVGHGIFTHYLLEGLAGGADGNRDGQVTFLELKTYVDSKVPAHARQVGTSQHPVMKGQLTGDIVLGTALP